MILEIINFPILILQSILFYVIKYTVTISFLYGLCHRLGIVQRLLQRHVELELSKVGDISIFPCSCFVMYPFPFIFVSLIMIKFKFTDKQRCTNHHRLHRISPFTLQHKIFLYYIYHIHH